MDATRRDFLRVTTLGGAAAVVFGFDLAPAFARLRALKIARTTETRSTCPYCAVSCGVIIYAAGDKAKNHIKVKNPTVATILVIAYFRGGTTNTT